MAERGALGLTAAPRRHEPALTAAVIQNRLRELQALCTDVQALLFVYGVDGQYNEGSRRVLNYLLSGYSGNDILQSTRTTPELEDVLLLVSRKECFLYLGTSEVYWKYLPLLGPVENLQLMATLPGEEKDPDQSEERKILCFLEMVEPFKRVGMHLSHRSSDISDVRSKPSSSSSVPAAPAGGAHLEIESWPLIQVYGVEELGFRGFFTLKHAVEDVGERLGQCMGEVDRLGLEALLTDHVDLLAFHWETALGSLDMLRAGERLRVSEAGLAEPLQSYFQYGLLRAADVEAQQGRRPLCALGLRSNHCLQRPDPDPAAKIGSSGVDGKAALQLVLEAAEPNGPLQAARTYFLSSGGAAERLRSFGWDGEVTAEEDNKLERAGMSAYARGLMVAYQALMQVWGRLAEAWCGGGVASEEGLRAEGVRQLETLQLEWLRKSDLRASFALSLSATDMAGRPASPTRGARSVKYLRLALTHVMSLDMAPVDLGGVLYGDSFVDCPAHAQQPSAPCVLTVGIERHAGWMAAGQEEDTEHMWGVLQRLRASKKHIHMSMGPLLQEEALVGVRMLTGMEELPTLQGELWVFARGLVFTSHRLGSLCLDFTHSLASLYARAGDEETAPEALLVLTLKEPLTRFGILEATLRPADSAALAFKVAGPDRRTLTREIVPAWREWAQSQGLPSAPPPPPAAVTREASSGVARKGSAEGAVAVYEVSSAPWAAQLQALQHADASRHLPVPPASLPPRPRRLGLQVVLGEPGTDKARMLRGLMDMAGASRRRALLFYRSPRHALDIIDPAQVAKTVLGALGEERACLVVSTFAGAVEVARAVCSEELQAQGVVLERVAAVVNAPSVQGAASVGVERRLAGQCQAGVVDAVVLVNVEAMAGPALAEAQQHLRLVNPQARVVRAVAGMVVAAADVESLLGPDDPDPEAPPFQAPAAAALRLSLCPRASLPLPLAPEPASVWGAWKGGVQLLEFTPPPELRLVRPNLIRALRSLFASPLETLDKYVAAHGDGKEAAMEVLSVSATVMVHGSEEEAEAGAEARASVVKAKRGFVTVSPSPPSSSSSPSLRVAVAGRRLAPEPVVHALLQGRALPLQDKAVRKAEDLTVAERATLRKQSLAVPLPDGYFFNGSHFLDFSGDVLEEHPSMPDIVADFLREENLEAERFNAAAGRRRAAEEAALQQCLQEAQRSLQLL